MGGGPCGYHREKFSGGWNSQCKGPEVGNFTKGEGDSSTCNQVNRGESVEGELPDAPWSQIVLGHRDHARRVPLTVGGEQILGGQRCSREPSEKATTVVQAGDAAARPVWNR